MSQLQDVHVANGDRVVVGEAGAAVVQRGLTVELDEAIAVNRLRVEVGEDRLNRRVLAGSLFFVPVRTIEHRSGDERAGLGDRTSLGLGAADGCVADGLVVLHVGPAPTSCVTEVRFKNLADVHTARNTQRVEDDVDGGAIGHVRHVFDREDLGDDALVAVAAGELVANADLALLCDVHAHELVDAGRQLVAVVAAEHLDVDDLAALAVRNLEAGVANFAGLLAEDGAQQALFRSELGLALRRDLADQHVARTNFGTNADDAALVEVAQDVVAEVRNVAADFFRAQLRVARIDFVLLDVDRREHVVLHQALAEDDGVFEVVALPRHQRDEQVLAQREFAVIGAGAVGEDRALDDLVAILHAHAMVDASVLVRATELAERIDRLAARVLAVLRLVVDGDARAADFNDVAFASRLDEVGRVARCTIFDAGADVRRLGAHQRDCLALHVGAHQRAVRVVVLEERNQRGGD